jgi:hypothetical protein
MKLRWRFGLIAGVLLALFSLYPQFKMIYLRGSEWNGHYAYNDIDEVAYASYLKALIDGRPRRNDPYTGRDDSPQSPQPESLFSIQFAGPYTIAIPARLLGIGAPWALTISGAIAAFLTALAIFWLVGMLTGDSLYAMAASLIVLAGGALFAGEGAIGEITGWSYAYPYFPGFRRYVPAMAFPAFFVLVALIWRYLGESDRERGERWRDKFWGGPILLAVLSGAAFAYTVFSYFYVWTTAAAWLGCLVICWVAARPERAWADLRWLAGVGGLWLTALIPYAYLLSNRTHTMDDVQMLVRTHAPDLFRPPELVSFVVIAAILLAAVFKIFSIRGRATLFALSLALTPIAVFNQQVITGQSLQPIHYQVFIGNYVAGLAAVITGGLFWTKFRLQSGHRARIAAISMALIATLWGFVECHYTVRILDDVNIARDESFRVGEYLTQLDEGGADVHKKVVLHFGTAEADDLPTIAPQSVLWARHQHVFAGVTWEENKLRYFQQLYYEGVSPKHLADGMKRGGDFVSMIAIFGWGRHTDRLNSEYKPLTFAEIDFEANKYAEYIASFGRNSEGAIPLNYLVVSNDREPFLQNVDKLYVRDEGKDLGKYTVYRLTPK